MLENKLEKVINFDLVLAHLQMRWVLQGNMAMLLVCTRSPLDGYERIQQQQHLAGDEWSVKLRKCVASHKRRPRPSPRQFALVHFATQQMTLASAKRKEQMFIIIRLGYIFGSAHCLLQRNPLMRHLTCSKMNERRGGSRSEVPNGLK